MLLEMNSETWNKLLGRKTTYYFENIDYVKFTSEETKFLRPVTGAMPFLQVWDPKKKISMISPQTLQISFKTAGTFNSNPVVQLLHRKEDGTPYSDEESFCPYAAKRSLSMRFAINVFDVNEFLRKGINTPIQVLYLSQTLYSELQMGKPFKSKECWDFDKGWIFSITAQGNVLDPTAKLRYSGKWEREFPLSSEMRQRCALEKLAEDGLGTWPLRIICHPFKCSRKQAVDNGHNPLFGTKP